MSDAVEIQKHTWSIISCSDSELKFSVHMLKNDSVPFGISFDGGAAKYLSLEEAEWLHARLDDAIKLHRRWLLTSGKADGNDG